MKNCPKHIEFYSQNKFEKLVHLVGFVIRENIPLGDFDVKTFLKIKVGASWNN